MNLKNKLITKVIILNDIVKKEYYNDYIFSKKMCINELLILNYLLKMKFLNCPKIIKSVVKKNKRIIILEKLLGNSLDKIDLKKLNVEYKIALFKKILITVKKLHYLNVIHNDLSLSNIFLTYKNDIYLLDYSISNCLYKSREEFLAGTNKYSPLEKFSKKYVSTYATDIYSLTAILYEFLTNSNALSSYERYMINYEYITKDEKVNIFFKRAYSIDVSERIKTIDEYIDEFSKIENNLKELYEKI